MSNNHWHLSKLKVNIPQLGRVRREIESIRKEMEASRTDEEIFRAFKKWNEWKAKYGSIVTLAEIRFHQDSESKKNIRNNDFAAQELSPLLEVENSKTEKVLLKKNLKSSLVKKYGQHLVALWKTHASSVDPSIEAEVGEEKKQVNDYFKLLFSYEVNFRGKKYKMEGMGKFYRDRDRNIRKEAFITNYRWYDERKKELDEIYDAMVKSRNRQAKKLGAKNFVEIGYQRMGRTDYRPKEVARFREFIAELYVPMCVKIRERQRRNLGLDTLYAWDLDVHENREPLRPQGEYEKIISTSNKIFTDINPELGKRFSQMVREGLVDFENRKEKGSGGFCNQITAQKKTFLFGVYTGETRDLQTLFHEAGHGFQSELSKHFEPVEYAFPTSEAAEIHSFGMEMLTHLKIGRIFSDGEQERYRREHLTERILTLPYMCTVDEFQHWVYENPNATPDERGDAWEKITMKFEPWMNFDGVGYPRSRRWQRQRHIYGMPFYYIDYALALLCAFELWRQSRVNPKQAIKNYLALCEVGGSLPFTQIIKKGSIKSPFEKNTIEEIVRMMEDYLEL